MKPKYKEYLSMQIDSSSLLTVCDPQYMSLCERGYELYLAQDYEKELEQNALARITLLDNSPAVEGSELLYRSDYQDAHSHYLLALYGQKDHSNFGKKATEIISVYRRFSVSLEAQAVALKALNRVQSLQEYHSFQYYNRVVKLDRILNQEPTWEHELEIPVYNETIHRASRLINSLYSQIQLENKLEFSANREINLVQLSKTLLVLQKLCATIFV